MFKFEKVQTESELQHAAHMHYLLAKAFEDNMKKLGKNQFRSLKDTLDIESSKEQVTQIPHNYLIYNEKGQLIGLISFTLEASKINEGVSVIIKAIYIMENYRKQGAGRAAIEMIRNTYPKHSIEVSQEYHSEECEAFLKKIGFIPVKVQYLL